ncbi:MAG: CehA/McbA family metallohydrolase [Deltaproteobacteria bacterium]|nr:CehA/McbA family metallohydrolase [Deltaproteobacteria bacterium]
MRMRPLYPIIVPALAGALVGCGSGDGTTLDDFLPPVPKPTGEAQDVLAGRITQEKAGELIDGPAKSGLVGDYYIRNSRVRFVIQQAARFIGVVPWGGNVVDAALLDESGKDVAPDHFGEIALMYVAGRTCAHESVEVLLDGSRGGPAVILARGRAALDDFINLKGMAVFDIPPDIDPTLEDGVKCATTYTLWPGKTTLEVAWTLFNDGDAPIRGPLGALGDSGGNVYSFSPGHGFRYFTVDNLNAAAEPAPAPYQVIQGPGVAYGYWPRHDDPATPNAVVTVAGASFVIMHAEGLLDFLDEETWKLQLKPGEGVTKRMDIIVGRDGGDIDAAVQEASGKKVQPIGGTVRFAPSGKPGAGARVGFFLDRNGNGAIDEKDPIQTYFHVKADGSFAGKLAQGSYLVRADIPDVARSAVLKLTVGSDAAVGPLAIEFPDPARYEFSVVEDETGDPIPAKLTVIGRHPVTLDERLQPAFDRRFGVVRILHAAHGASVGPEEALSDGPLLLPAGGPYRVHASRGPEWSVGEQVVTAAPGASSKLEFRLRRVVDTTGYVATEFHQHALGSPDSFVSLEDRVKTLVAEGVEFFASSDHDYLSDYAPFIDQLKLRPFIDSTIGVESTPFAWGHFIAWPLVPDEADPSRGAPDWALGAREGFDMLPVELWKSLRDRGARVVQVNHPRIGGMGNFMAYFDRCGLTFDFANRTFYGTPGEPVPSSWLRMPENMDIFSDEFDTLEVWNRFVVSDSDKDGVREISSLDRILRDWMNFLSFGRLFTPMGNSDSHTLEKDPAGLPRTLVRVADDSAESLHAGIEDDIVATLLGAKGAPRDVVVTNGPMVRVLDAPGSSAVGKTITATAGKASLTVEVQSAEWVTYDTVEVFANTTFEPADTGPTALVPLLCFTSRDLDSLTASDPCKLAPLGAKPLVVRHEKDRYESVVKVELAEGDVVARAGARGKDAWIVVRVRGQRALYPVLLHETLDEASLDKVVSAKDDAELEAALGKKGIPAVAFTAPVLVDFDGNGFLAPFAP